jgi:DNA ligase-1
MLLAKPFDPDKHDIKGWWASEKLDGVRAYWNGKNLMTRNNNVLHAPQWFLDDLPKNCHLDGELFMGRGKFQQTVSVVRKHDGGDLWKGVRYLVFDIPTIPGGFEARYEALKSIFRGSQYCERVTHQQVHTTAEVAAEAKKVWALGGEGIMLRQPGSKYERKRSSTLLKVKNFFDDIALVVDHEPGKGKHEGRLGALVCLTSSTKLRFQVGTGFSDAERESPPPVGTLIKYAYTELTDAGIPRFPRYLCIHKGD